MIDTLKGYFLQQFITEQFKQGCDGIMGKETPRKTKKSKKKLAPKVEDEENVNRFYSSCKSYAVLGLEYYIAGWLGFFVAVYFGVVYFFGHRFAKNSK